MHASIALTRYGGREMGVKSSLFVERKGKSLRQHGMKERKKQIETVTHRKPDGQTRVLRDRKTSRQAGRQADRQTEGGKAEGPKSPRRLLPSSLVGGFALDGWMVDASACASVARGTSIFGATHMYPLPTFGIQENCVCIINVHGRLVYAYE
mmetsp:Transcript_29908/g.58670  ORF Transcript_29908/g.58670 Transcript_29908/m.58670 type:complete len:152 (-) Transcript_29908:281-736(-)